MKNMIRLFLGMAIGLVAMSCQDEVDVEGKLSFPPTVLSVYPKTSVKVGNDFDVKVIFVDGASSPLSSATLSLKNEAGTELFNVTKAISGNKDSVVVTSDDFDASALPLGTYTLTISATDSRNNEVNTTSTFKVAEQLYAANFARMNITGQFADWGADKSVEMELVSDNMWQAKGVDFKGGPWKFRNTIDWSGVDWGDGNCDKVAAHGSDNVDCGYTGLMDVTFNDDTWAYTVKPSVTYKTGLASLYVLGTMNNFEGVVPKFDLVADYTWEIPEVRLKPTDVFRFSELPGFAGAVYGAGKNAGEAALKAENNISMPDGSVDAYYKISFNEQTLKYTLTVVRLPFPSELYMVGGSTSIGWDPANAIPFRKTGDGKFEVYAYLTVVADGNGIKFLQQRGWDGDWGKNKTTAGTLEQNDEENIPIAADGFYYVTADFSTMKYTVTQTTWSIIGSAITGDDTGWSVDKDMTFDSGYTWTITQALKTGQFKFRANHDWPINYGDEGADKKLDFNSGVNIEVPADDTYKITVTFDPVAGYTYTMDVVL